MSEKKEAFPVPDALGNFFEQHPRVALAFSGGCDSAYLFYAALACGAQVEAYYVCSSFQPAFERADARRLAELFRGKLHELSVDVLADAQVRENPAERCYFCKRRIFSAIAHAAQTDGYTTIIDGTNASDDAFDRPGMRALQEMQVLSPLRLCGMEKKMVRALSRTAGLFTWDKPAYACLATRVPTGVPITAEMLEKVERVETRLAEMGFSDFRARLNGNGVRLELPEVQMEYLLQRRLEVLAALEADFSEITLNLRARGE